MEIPYIDDLPSWAKQILFFTLWIILWTGAFITQARITGWHKLAQHYRATKNSPLKGKFEFKTILLRFRLSYEFATKIAVEDGGLNFSLFFLFRPGHPKLFIPWSEIIIEKPEQILFKYIRLKFKKVPDITMRIPFKLWQKIEACQISDSNSSS